MNRQDMVNKLAQQKIAAAVVRKADLQNHVKDLLALKKYLNDVCYVFEDAGQGQDFYMVMRSVSDATDGMEHLLGLVRDKIV